MKWLSVPGLEMGHAKIIALIKVSSHFQINAHFRVDL